MAVTVGFEPIVRAPRHPSGIPYSLLNEENCHFYSRLRTGAPALPCTKMHHRLSPQSQPTGTHTGASIELHARSIARIATSVPYPMMLEHAMQAPDEVDPALAESLRRIVRGGWDEIESSVVEFGPPTSITGSKATLRCHFLRSDPNGRPRLTALAQQLADQVVHFCIPRSDLVEAMGLTSDRAATAVARLARDAAKLFTQTQLKTGEGAELMLFVLLEKSLGIPQVLSKMSLKTSTEMQYHGADGVHAELLENGDLALYWGEAKLYESVPEAMSDCLDSLAPYLKGDAQEQDVYLLRHYADTGQEELTARLLEYFDYGSMKSADVEMRGACLIGFNHADYPSLPRELESSRSTIEETVQSWQKSMATRLKNRGLLDFVIEVFFVPVPSVVEFRTAVKRELGIPVATG